MKIETKFDVGQKVWIIADNGGVFSTPEIKKDEIKEIIINLCGVFYRFKNFNCCGMSAKWLSKTKKGIKKIMKEELL